jgi:RNA polymerase sigma factor (sigma-70 family)
MFTLLTQLTMREDIAEELMQELFIKLVRFKNLDKVDNLETYARQAAVSLALDWRKKHKLQTLSLQKAAKLPSDENPPLSKLVEDEQLQKVLDAIGELKGLPRDAFVMRYVQQQPYNDIAAQLGKTPHQIRALCHKALNHLRFLLSGGDLPPSKKGDSHVSD